MERLVVYSHLPAHTFGERLQYVAAHGNQGSLYEVKLYANDSTELPF